MTEKETLPEYVSRIMREKGLSGADVESGSRREITQSYVNKLKNGTWVNPSTTKLSALARGLGVPAGELFTVVFGTASDPNFEEALQIAFHDADNWTDDEKKEALQFVRTYAEGVRARRSHK